MKRVLLATETVAAVFLLLIALLTASNVLLRYFFGQTIPDWYDGTRLLLGIAIFWGISITTYRGGHICVDMLWEMLGRRNRRRLDALANVLTVSFLAPLAWMVWVKVLNTGAQATSDLRIPMMWLFAVAATGAVVAALLAVLRCVEVISGSDTNNRDPEIPYGS